MLKKHEVSYCLSTELDRNEKQETILQGYRIENALARTEDNMPYGLEFDVLLIGTENKEGEYACSQPKDNDTMVDIWQHKDAKETRTQVP